MQIIFSFTKVAIIVRHWFEVTERDEEHGCRVELRLLEPCAHRGTESAAQRITLDEPVWRGDIFETVDNKRGYLDRAHYHPHFAGVEPSQREYETQISADPLTWLSQQLENINALIGQAGLSHSIDDMEQSAITAHLDEIGAAVQRRLGTQCDSPSVCTEETRDVGHLVPRMHADLRSVERGVDPRADATDWEDLVRQRPETS